MEPIEDLTFVPLIGLVMLGFAMFLHAINVRKNLPTGALCSYGWAPAFLIYLYMRKYFYLNRVVHIIHRDYNLGLCLLESGNRKRGPIDGKRYYTFVDYSAFGTSRYGYVFMHTYIDYRIWIDDNSSICWFGQ